MKLTRKQEIFVQNLFKGMTQREAWIQAGYSSNYSMAILDSNACRLANSDKIQARYKELTQKTEDESVANVLERKRILTEIAQGTYKTPITAQDKVRAISELNKMEGDYAVEKHAVLGGILIEIVHKEG